MAVTLRPSRAGDLGWITALERHPENREFIGQWSDAEHASAIAGENARSHWIIERDGEPAGYLIAYDGGAHYPGVYVKRVLIARKERGTGQAALAAFLDGAFAAERVTFAWLLVFRQNERAQAVYRKLGFAPFEPDAETARTLGLAGDPPFAAAIAMRLERERWRRRAR
jgi:ribosomal protein S18 acetylase RimI-like enzyme